MKFKFLIFISSVKEPQDPHHTEVLIKTIESEIRPVKGDIIDDPGFHPGFHNGYEVAKVTLNYETNVSYVSLAPLVLEHETISAEAYIERLQAHGWRAVSPEELKRM